MSTLKGLSLLLLLLLEVAGFGLGINVAENGSAFAVLLEETFDPIFKDARLS